jgi:L-asparaginase II
VQEAARAELAEAAEVSPDGMPTAVDGCGVITFALPLERMARAFSRLAELDAGPRVAAAMQAHPHLVRGPGAADTELMRVRPGWTAKGGAEGVFCAAGPDGLGLALKCEDGNGRALGPALAAFLRALGRPVEELAVRELRNSRDEVVGAVAAKL